VTKSRWISLGVAVLYVGLFGFSYLTRESAGADDAQGVFAILLFWLLMSLAVIWFADAIAPFLGRGRMDELIRADWTIVVALIGWIMLLLPGMLILARKLR